MLPAGLSPRRRIGQLSALLALLVCYSAQLAGALLPHLHLFVAGSAAGLAVDLLLQHKQPGLLSLLNKVRFDVPVRQLLRDMLLIIGLVKLPGMDPLEEQPIAVTLLGCYVAYFLGQAVALLVRRVRVLPVVTRNIDTSALGLTRAPSHFIARQPSRRLLYFSIPGTVGLLVSAATGEAVWGLTGLAVTLALSVGTVVYLAGWLLPSRRPPNEQQVLRWLDQWLAEYRPTIGMYFSGGTTSAYQANMWLSTLASLKGRPLIVLRERYMVQRIDATDVPIICLPKVAHLMRLEHSTLRVLLHPANSGKTSQVLRIPTIKHVFINHGESDKLSSCNPYAKAYDEIWVAGQAARERYQLADIGVDDRNVVEVGRPQLAPIKPYEGPPTGAYTTVLYAPTWEGWTDSPGNTSIILAGENIVRKLLADPRVRLLYKPHPLTGSVNPRAAQADARIRAMIREANAARSGPRPGPEVAAELARRTAELDRLTATDLRPDADEVERMLLQSAPEDGRAAALELATAAWEEAFWASLPEWEHQVITGNRPAIYSCFNQADLLISDVSSVVSDYLSSEKPYAVANTSGLSEAEFRENYPTVRAATILTPDAEGIPALLESVRDPAKDTLAAARAELKVYLLGPADPPSLVRFDEAAQALYAKAVQRERRMAQRAASGIPDQPERVAEAEETTEAGTGQQPVDA